MFWYTLLLRVMMSSTPRTLGSFGGISGANSVGSIACGGCGSAEATAPFPDSWDNANIVKHTRMEVRRLAARNLPMQKDYQHSHWGFCNPFPVEDALLQLQIHQFHLRITSVPVIGDMFQCDSYRLGLTRSAGRPAHVEKIGITRQ